MVTEERTEPDSSRGGDVRSGDGFDESRPTGIPVPLDAGAVDRSRSNPSPCSEMGEESSGCKYPKEDDAAASDLDPDASADPECHKASGTEGEPGSKRFRQRKGYYKHLNEGTL